MQSIGPVMANSIASYSNCVESVARARHPCNESSFTSSEMETVAKLSSELPGIIPVRSAKGVGVIEEIARIADVLRGERDSETLAEGFSERERKLRVAGEMVGAVSIEESRAVAQIPRRKRAPRQSGVKADAERISLVVVEEKKSLVRRSEIGEATRDRPGAFHELMGIGQINLEAIRDARRARGQFPTVNAGTIDRQRKENVGIAEHVMIEEIPNVRLEIGNIKLPAADRNGQAEFALFVSFAAQGQEVKPLIDGLLQERAGNREKRRSLIVAAVEGAENPIELRHAKSSTDARIHIGFGEPARKMRVAEPAIEREPIGDAVLIFGKERKEPASWAFRLAERRTGAVGSHETKECVVLLREAIETGACIVPTARDS